MNIIIIVILFKNYYNITFYLNYCINRSVGLSPSRHILKKDAIPSKFYVHSTSEVVVNKRSPNRLMKKRDIHKVCHICFIKY